MNAISGFLPLSQSPSHHLRGKRVLHSTGGRFVGLGVLKLVGFIVGISDGVLVGLGVGTSVGDLEASNDG